MVVDGHVLGCGKGKPVVLNGIDEELPTLLGDGIEDNDAIGKQVFAYFSNDFIHLSPVPPDEYGVGGGKVVQFRLQKITDPGDDAGRPETHAV